MEHEGISLGWNCESAINAVNMGIRKRKQEGYLTCPFDECITNYDGIILCLKEDFKHFCDLEYLKIIPAKYNTGGIVKNERLIYNTRYNFIFNHESPDHANLYIKQQWAGGKEHYIANDYSLFIERYTRRIDNFRRYIKNIDIITFFIGKFDTDVTELSKVIKTLRNDLAFDIYCYIPGVSRELFDEHYKLMMP